MTPPASRLRGLTIDMDGTLMDSMAFHARAWSQAFADIGLNAPLDWFLLWEGINAREVIPLALAALTADLDGEEQARLHARKLQYFDEWFRPIPIPGLDALRDLLAEMGCAVAVVTGSENRVARRALEAIGFLPVVSVVVGGDDVLRGKPAPDPYARAVVQLGLPVEHTLALENAPVGIQSAQAAELVCVAVTTTLPADQLRAADLVLADLPAFCDWLRAEYRRSGGLGPWRLG